MAIQSRRGNKVNFDKDKMLPGEFGVALDSQEAFICFGAGVTKKMATDEDYADMMEECVTATENAKQATVNANTAVEDFKGLVVSKLAINDAVKSTTSGWSSTKIGAELDTAKATLNTSLANQIGTIQGTNISIPNLFNGGLLLKELQGKTVATGTPTPETPITFASVGDSGSVVAKVDNKNLYTRFTNMTQGGVTLSVSEDGTVTLNGTSNNPLHFGVPFVGHLPAGTYTLSANNPQLSNIVHVKLSSNASGGIYQNAYLELNAANKTKAFILSAGAPVMAHIYVAPGTVLNNFIIKPQLELGSSATPYEPYKEQLVTIPLTQPLRSVGSVCDRGCVKSGGLWGNERKTITVTYDGSADEFIGIGTTNTTGKKRCMITPIISAKPSISQALVSEIYCDKFNAVSPNSTYSLKDGICVDTSGFIFVYYEPLSGYTTSGEFRTWLASNPIAITYQLATPVFEPYPQSLQDQLNKLQSYQGVTNVFTTDALQPTLIVEYGKTDTAALTLYANNIYDSKLDKANVANNLVTTQEGFVADARTVKTLKDSVDVLNNNLSKILTTNISNTDLNNFSGYFGYGYGLINAPGTGACVVLQLPYYSNNPNYADYGAQLIFSTEGIFKPKCRTKTNNIFSDWIDL